MKLLKSIFILSTIFYYGLNAQDCTAYIPYEKGTKLELTSYNNKDKVTSVINQEVVAVSKEGNTTLYKVHQVYAEKRGSNPMEGDLIFKCEDNVFYVDMSKFINNQMMGAYQNMQMEVTTDEIDIPADPKVGQTLKDGSINIKIQSSAPIAMNMSIDVKNRKVEAIESVTVPAGTFKCVKISEEITSQMGMSITMNNIEWYSEGVGIIKSEIYKNGNFEGKTELTKLTKP